MAQYFKWNQSDTTFNWNQEVKEWQLFINGDSLIHSVPDDSETNYKCWHSENKITITCKPICLPTLYLSLIIQQTSIAADWNKHTFTTIWGLHTQTYYSHTHLMLSVLVLSYVYKVKKTELFLCFVFCIWVLSSNNAVCPNVTHFRDLKKQQLPNKQLPMKKWLPMQTNEQTCCLGKSLSCPMNTTQSPLMGRENADL